MRSWQKKIESRHSHEAARLPKFNCTVTWPHQWTQTKPQSCFRGRAAATSLTCPLPSCDHECLTISMLPRTTAGILPRDQHQTSRPLPRAVAALRSETSTLSRDFDRKPKAASDPAPMTPAPPHSRTPANPSSLPNRRSYPLAEIGTRRRRERKQQGQMKAPRPGGMTVDEIDRARKQTIPNQRLCPSHNASHWPFHV